MSDQAIRLGGKRQQTFIDQVKALLPEDGNLGPCLTCGACSSGCPATGAQYCIAGCHNCRAQIHELSEHYGVGYHLVHLWTLICLSLGILGLNEREYLGDDLKDVDVCHPETAM